MYLLDTDTLVHLFARHPLVVRHLAANGRMFAVSTVISKVELLRGRHEFLLKAKDGQDLLRAQQLLDETEQSLEQVLILDVDAKSAEWFDRLRGQRALRKVGRADLLIAGIVLAHDATLVSRNLRDFRRVPGLKVVNWVD